MQTNGTTAWIADPATGEPKRIFCVTSIQIGEPSRTVDTDRKLEDKDERKGNRAGTGIELGDTTLEGEFDEGLEALQCICEWFLNGRELLPGETFSDGFETQLAVASCDGCVFYVGVWVKTYGLGTIESDGKFTVSITFETLTCWCGDKGNWEEGTVPSGFDNWSSEIGDYYTAVAPAANAVGFKARQVAMQKATAKTARVQPAATVKKTVS